MGLRLYYTSCPSNLEQTVSEVEKGMQNLQERGLGKCEKLQRHTIFCKALPSEIRNNKFLGMYKLNQTIYKNIFKKKDEKAPHFNVKKCLTNIRRTAN